MIVQTERTRCTGCTACAAVCPKNCITIEADREGFLYPVVDMAACIRCGRCEAVCPPLHPRQGETTPGAYGVQAKDTKLRLKSSSGGVFSLLAQRALKQGGAVFGAAMTPDCKGVRHVMVTEEACLDSLRGSKYLQSELGDTFRRVKRELERGRTVLFTGTPCQVDGLNSYLGRGYDSLLCMEVICHGVPSPALWKKYVEDVERRNGQPLSRVNFRLKEPGWKRYGVQMETPDGRKRYNSMGYDPYMRMFLQDKCLRPACYQCFSKGLDRSADLTVGDFWGIQNVAPELDDDKGTSLVLTHTEKGRQALETILDQTDWKAVDLTAALQGNPAMLRSAPRPAARDTFFTDMENMSFEELRRNYVPVTAKERMIRLLGKTELLPLAAQVVHLLKKKE